MDNNLLLEFKENRKKIYDMIEDLEKYIDSAKALLPTTNNYDKDFRRASYKFEQNLKTVTEFLKLIFEMRKEIGKSIKDEVNMVKGDDKDDEFDVQELMKKIDKGIGEIEREINR